MLSWISQPCLQLGGRGLMSLCTICISNLWHPLNVDLSRNVHICFHSISFSYISETTLFCFIQKKGLYLPLRYALNSRAHFAYSRPQLTPLFCDTYVKIRRKSLTNDMKWNFTVTCLISELSMLHYLQSFSWKNAVFLWYFI